MKKDLDYLTLLGACYLKQKAFGKAENVMKRVLDLKPKKGLGPIYLAYADALDGGGKTAEAVAAYEKAVKFEKKNGMAFFKIGSYYGKTKKWKSAIQPLLKALSLKTNVDAVHVVLADALYNTKSMKAAIPHLEAVNKKNPGQPETLERLVQTYLAVKNSKNAVKYLSQLEKKAPERFSGNYLAALAYIAEKQDKKAEPVLVKYLEKHPKNQKALRALSDLYQRQKASEKAVEILRKLFALSKDAKIQREIGDLCMAFDKDKAAAAYEIYVKSFPKSKKVLVTLKGLYEAKKDNKALYPVLVKLVQQLLYCLQRKSLQRMLF